MVGDAAAGGQHVRGAARAGESGNATASTAARSHRGEKEEPKKEIKTEAPAAPKPSVIINTITPTISSSLAAKQADSDMAVAGASFFARYQILIAGLLMLTTAFGILFVFGSQRRLERRDEMKAIAAALRGELLGARAVCQTRLKEIVTDEDDQNISWPRLRSTLYQAYVGRLGWLGAGLARQVASIYGQASDYASYYNAGDDAAMVTPKRHALQSLLSHIDEVLPRLAMIEKTGRVPNPRPATNVRPVTEWTQVRAPAGAPAAQPAPVEAALYKMQNAVATLWDILRKFAQEHLADRRTAVNANDDNADYTALIEQEIATMSFTEGEEPPLPDDKRHGTGA